MSRSTLAFLGMVFLTFSFCQPRMDVKTPAQLKREMVDRLNSETVALVGPRIDDEQNIQLVPYCSGVWIGEEEIITARHCIDDEPILMMQVYQDESIYSFKVVAEDEKMDLALLKMTSKAPQHPIATIAEETWPGEPVHIVGHTTGLSWTYIEGVVSSARKIRGQHTPPAIQISSPAWFGNSGGGAFDDDGRLVGVSSWVSTRAPMLSFFVNGEAIRKFLEAARKK